MEKKARETSKDRSKTGLKYSLSTLVHSVYNTEYVIKSFL